MFGKNLHRTYVALVAFAGRSGGGRPPRAPRLHRNQGAAWDHGAPRPQGQQCEYLCNVPVVSCSSHRAQACCGQMIDMEVCSLGRSWQAWGSRKCRCPWTEGSYIRFLLKKNIKLRKFSWPSSHSFSLCDARGLLGKTAKLALLGPWALR